MLKRNIERIKTALIVLLMCSAIVLGRATELFNDFFESIPILKNVSGFVGALLSHETGETPLMRTTIREAARPASIVITLADGAHYGVRYDTAEKNRVYDRTSSILGETLGSAEQPEEISEDVWRMALSTHGIYYEYSTSIPLTVLAGWLGSTLSYGGENLNVRRVCVTIGEDMNRIYFEDTNSKKYFRAETASFGGRLTGLGLFDGNGAEFAFETGLTALNPEPYMVLMPQTEHPEILAQAPNTPQELLNAALDSMGVNSKLLPVYSDTDSITVYGTSFRISVDNYSRVQYLRTGSADNLEYAHTISDMIEQARIIAEGTIGRFSGDAAVQFEGISHDSENTYTVTLGYTISGALVYLYADVKAAQITFEHGFIREINLSFRNYTLTDSYVKLLPERQALANEGAEFVLGYHDTGGTRLKPDWVIPSE